ncbi:MAG: hypothetical protein KAU14_07600, partial [Thermoplasmata archaeon]|nr:hypothetical protein [Thermoplasmata archaeon]
LMKSRGHFSKEQWEDATTNTTEGDPGNINITKLGVDGIIPDTTFGVKKNDEDGDGFIIGFEAVLVICAIGLAIVVSLRKGNR